MDIDKAIKQEKFQSIYQKILINILYTSSWLEDQNASIMRGKKLSITQFNVLRILRGSHPKPCTAQDIQERMIHKRSDVTRLVERLRKMELLTRDVCPENRRKVDILITEKGLSLLGDLDPEIEKSELSLSKLSEVEAEQLNKLLNKVRG